VVKQRVNWGGEGVEKAAAGDSDAQESDLMRGKRDGLRKFNRQPLQPMPAAASADSAGLTFSK